MQTRTQNLPDGWKVVQLGDVAEVVGGSTPSRSTKEFWGGNVSWVVPSELTDLQGRYLTMTNDSITDEGKKTSGLRLIPAGSVLLTSRATIGITAINAIPVTTNQGFQNLVVKNGTDPLWLYYSISSLRNELERRAAGSTFLEVSRDSVRSLPLLVPPPSEQCAIASVLDSIDEAIERTEAVITATEQLRDSLLHDLLTRGVPGWHSEWKEASGIGTIPASWDVVRLGDVATLQRGIDLPEDNRVYGQVPVYGANGIHGFHDTAPIAGPGVITGRSGSMGLVHYCESPFWPLNTTLFVNEFHGNNERYVYYLLSSLRLERFSASTGVPSLNRNFVHPVPVAVPPLQEQQTIVDILNSADDTTNGFREEREGLQSLKVSASDALLTGRVRMKVRNYNE